MPKKLLGYLGLLSAIVSIEYYYNADNDLVVHCDNQTDCDELYSLLVENEYNVVDREDLRLCIRF